MIYVRILYICKEYRYIFYILNESLRASFLSRNPYRFAVAAVNAAGEGPRSARVTLTASDVAGQPYDVQAADRMT